MTTCSGLFCWVDFCVTALHGPCWFITEARALDSLVITQSTIAGIQRIVPQHPGPKVGAAPLS